MGQAPAGAQAPEGSGLALFLQSPLSMMILIFVIFYFLLIRPQNKKNKAHQDMLNALKNGDRVITNGGIYGRVTKVEDAVVTVEVADRVRIKLSRQAIASLQAGGSSSQDESKNTSGKKE
jgi:preprotein translocase subunit YajC